MNTLDLSADIEYNLDKICRICLCVYDEFSSLFSSSSQQGFPIKINEQIMTCTQIQVSFNKIYCVLIPFQKKKFN